jgi:hypothetical protein
MKIQILLFAVWGAFGALTSGAMAAESVGHCERFAKANRNLILPREMEYAKHVDQSKSPACRLNAKGINAKQCKAAKGKWFPETKGCHFAQFAPSVKDMRFTLDGGN